MEIDEGLEDQPVLTQDQVDANAVGNLEYCLEKMNVFPKYEELLFHVDRITELRHLCILSSVAPDVIHMVHGQGHPGFSRCFEIISRSWYI